ncbi:retrotransposon protein, putative, ty1-copia subclass [Tanacetum coccineum]
MEVEGFEPPHEEEAPVRRSVRTHRAPERLCLNVEVGDHSLGDLNEPTNYKAAMLDTESNKWCLVDLPHDCKTVGSKWLFKKKTDMDGNVHTYKARLVAKGFTQLYGVDYEETFKMDTSKRGYIPMQERLDLNKTQGASTPGEVKQAEYIAASEAEMEAVWIRKFISGLGKDIQKRTKNKAKNDKMGTRNCEKAVKDKAKANAKRTRKVKVNKSTQQKLSSQNTVPYHLDLCKNVIGEGVYPVVEATNLYYGGADIAGIHTLPIYSLFQSRGGKTLQWALSIKTLASVRDGLRGSRWIEMWLCMMSGALQSKVTLARGVLGWLKWCIVVDKTKADGAVIQVEAKRLLQKVSLKKNDLLDMLLPHIERFAPIPTRRDLLEYDRREGRVVSRRYSDDMDYRETSPRHGRDNKDYDNKRIRYESVGDFSVINYFR